MWTRNCRALRCLWLCLISLACAAGDSGFEAPKCEDVSSLVAGQDKCEFVKDYCEQASMAVDWLRIYYCDVQPRGLALTVLMVMGCAVLLALLFRVIARTSDDFFACILSQISQDMGLPPRLGGVTLLALGNGAPDLSSSIAAVRTGNYRMALGSLTGGGMFVGCVVAGRILTLNGGAKARLAQIRDVSCYLIAVAVVTAIVASGRMTYGGVMTLLLLYSGYVVIVAVADFTKRAGYEWHEIPRVISRRISLRRQPHLAAPLLAPGSPSRMSIQLSDISEGEDPFHQEPEAAPSDEDIGSMELSSVGPARRVHPSSKRLLRFQESGGPRHYNGAAAAPPALADVQELPMQEPSPDRMDAYLQQQQAAAGAPRAAVVAKAAGQIRRSSQTFPPSHIPHHPTRLLSAPPGPRSQGSVSGEGERPAGAPAGSPAAASESGTGSDFNRGSGGNVSSSGINRGNGSGSGIFEGSGGDSGIHEGGGGSGGPVRRHFTLPVHLPGWLQHPLQHLPGGWQAQQQRRRQYHPARGGPTVAAFQPRVPYEDLVRMPAAEYRRRALAEMAQSRSFYVRDARDEGEDSSEEEGSDGEGGPRRDLERGGSGYSPPIVVPQPPGLPPVAVPRAASLPPLSPSGALAAAAFAEGGRAQAWRQPPLHASAPGRASSSPALRPLPGEEPESPEGQPLREIPRHWWPEHTRGPGDEAEAGAAGAAAASAGRGQGSAEQAEQAQPPAGAASRPAAAAAYHPAAELGSGQQPRPPLGGPPVAAFAARQPPKPPPQPPEQQPPAGEGEPPCSRPVGLAPPLPAPLQHRHTHYAQYEFGTGVGQGGGGPGAGEEEGEEEEGEEEAATEPGLGSKFVSLVEAPIMLVLQATVPLVEPNSYQRHWFILSMACSPFFICVFTGHHSWLPLLLATVAGGGLASVAVVGTQRLGNKPPFWGWGTHFPVGAALVAVYGFAVAAMWISLFASEIVALLHFLGVLGGLDGGVLGLTVLAWGNSLMDYLNNTSMAGKSAGGNSMAMTACYAGPLFNLLMSLGLGFWVALGEARVGSMPVALPATAAVGCVCIMVACAAIVAVAMAYNHWLPQWFGWVMVGWYGVYILVVLLVTLVF